MMKKWTRVTMAVVVIFSLMLNIQTTSYSATVTPFSGTTVSTGHAQAISIVSGNDGKLYVAEYGGNKIVKMDPDGQNKITLKDGLSQPIGIAFDGSGNLYVAEHNGRKVGKIDTDGNYTIIKYTGSGFLTGLVLDSAGKVFTVDYIAGKIYKMDANGDNFTEFASGLGTSSLIGLTIDELDNLYVSDRNNSKIIKIEPNGTISTFVTGVSIPTWITLGEDDYFYVSAGSRTVEKIDRNGNKVASFATGTNTPWGSYVTKDGYIYFTNISSAISKIVGSASTTDTLHISLQMNTTMEEVQADPTAFLLSGIASNPQVVTAAVSGQSISLSLSAPITSSDTNIKIDYMKTGTNNLVVLGSAVELGNFAGLPVANNIPYVTNVGSISDISVANGTLQNTIGLPETVAITLSNSTTTIAAVTWDAGTPAYSGNTAGIYAFSGTLSLNETISNPINLKARVNVIVQAVPTPDVTSVGTIPDISVANGTLQNIIGLPETVAITLSNSTTTSAAVTWDGGTPAYNGNTAGIYAFSGTFLLNEAILNPSNMKASVNVIVQAAVTNDITSVESISDITVANGTSQGAINMPESVTIMLSNSTTTSAAVTWDAGTPIYSGNAAGTYVFSGALSLNEVISNPSNLKASVNVIVQAAPSSSSDSSSSSTETLNTTIIVNGLSQNAGMTTTSIVGAQTVTTVTIDDTKIQEIIHAADNKATVSIPISGRSDIGEGVLNGKTIKAMEIKEAILEIKTDSVTYCLPAAEIDIDNVASQIGQVVDLKDIRISVKILTPTAETLKIVEDIANKNGYQIVLKPINFEITCTSGDKTVNVSKFEGYVERTIAIPDGVDPGRITTGIVLNKDGTFSHVPTTIININGKYYAKINSLTNSTYSVIYNPIEYTDITNHWAKDAINEMGSRLVVSERRKNIFEPDEDITRAEFAAIIVRALGLTAGTGDNSFADVKTSADINNTDGSSRYVETAVSYGIITGYPDGTFGPENKITREQAMTMIARTMKLTDLYSTLTAEEINTHLSSYSDRASASGYTEESIAICLKKGIFTGKTKNSIAPKDYLTRAEAAVIIERVLRKSGLI